MKQRLDQALVELGLVSSRSQAESFIKLGKVTVDGREVLKPGTLVEKSNNIKFTAKEQYVSRAGLKLASVADKFKLNFKGKVVLDVGSSTGGFTDFALQHGASKVYAVDVGTNQLHPSLHGNPRIELHEQTDIRQVTTRSKHQAVSNKTANPVQLTAYSLLLPTVPDIILIDISFISLRDVLPHIATLSGPGTLVIAMAKPQFETGGSSKHDGVIKNARMRRNTLQNLENWIKKLFVLLDKADSQVAGAKGNVERFYLLKVI